MSAPTIEPGKEAPMSPRNRNRLLALAAVPAAAALIGLWAVTQGRAEDGSPPPAESAPAAADPHAGHGTAAAVPVDGTIRIDPETARSMGVTVVEAELAPLSRSIRTNGNVVFDETRQTTVTPKFSGYVERLYVDFTGQPVRRGQALLEIYSPELVAAQEELLSALRMERQLREGAAPPWPPARRCWWTRRAAASFSGTSRPRRWPGSSAAGRCAARSRCTPPPAAS
jgi:multidrug efflux pump subunit AcrA (membrane-fusion protein)